MHRASILLASLFLFGACNGQLEQAHIEGVDASIKPQDGGDMKIPDPPCAPAAKGLSGTPISGTCVDFSKLTDPPVAAGWNFGFIQGSCSSWQIQNGKLLPKSNNKQGDCAFTMPSLTAADYSQYDSLTLSVVHTSNITTVGETTTISIPVVVGPPPENQVWANTATNVSNFRQVTTVTMFKPQINNLDFTPKFTFRTPTSTDLSADWQIESIVIMGNKQ